MLQLTIEVEGKRWNDLEFALEVILERIKEEYLTGFDSNDTGSYSFNVTGEEEESDEEED